VKPAILIVDDSLTVRMDLSEALESPGFYDHTLLDLGGSAQRTLEWPICACDSRCSLAGWDGIELLRR